MDYAAFLPMLVLLPVIGAVTGVIAGLLGVGGGIVVNPGDIAYVSVGLTPLMGEDGAAGLPLFRQADDNDTTGGAVILAAGGGGGLDKNCWSDAINIPFAFRLYGQPFTQFCVSKHGLLTFSTAVAGQAIPTTPLSIDVNWPMPNQYYPENTIAMTSVPSSSTSALRVEPCRNLGCPSQRIQTCRRGAWPYIHARTSCPVDNEWNRPWKQVRVQDDR